MMKLYSLQFCPYCEMVIKKLDELGLPYEKIEVPAARPQREEVFQVSGQYTVPVLQDEDTVLADEQEILEHLERKYNSSNKGD